MFNFFKKKEKSFEAPPKPEGSNAYATFQKTKVEDDVASFEVPDFSEDDLNFDLGLGEFMPTNSNFIEPKGLPTENPSIQNESNQGINPSEIDPNSLNMPSNFNEFENSTSFNSSSNKPDVFSSNASSSNTSSSNTFSSNTSMDLDETKFIESENEAPIIQDANVSNLDNAKKIDSQKQNLEIKSDFHIDNNFSWGAESKTEELSAVDSKVDELNANDEELPKFNTQGDINFYTSSIIQERIVPKNSIKSKHNVKQKKQITKIEPIQSSKEGIFLPKQVMQKMIILADDTTRKTASAESLKAGFVTISNMQDSNVDDLIRTMKLVRDSLIIADTKLFGRGEE